MCVYTSKPAKSVGRYTRSPEIRHFDLLRIADHHVFDLSLSVYKYADLASGLVREVRHLAGKFGGDDLIWRNASRGEAFDPADLIVFQPLCEAVDIADKRKDLRVGIISNFDIATEDRHFESVAAMGYTCKCDTWTGGRVPL
jgi:hypothetical protein